jgi:hypothetical protein
MKICTVGADLFHADGQTDTRQVTVAFRNAVNVLLNISNILRISFPGIMLYLYQSAHYARWVVSLFPHVFHNPCVLVINFSYCRKS